MNTQQTARVDSIVRDADLLHCAHAKLRTDNAEVQRFLSEVSWQLNAMHKAEDAGRRFEQFIVGADVACENGWTAMIQARKEEDATTYHYHPSHDAVVTADDIRQDRNADNAEAAADPEYAVHECATCDNLVPLSRERCDPCNARISAETAATIAAEKPAWNARLAARAAAIVTAAGGLALALCLTGTPASASEVYHTGQSVIIGGSNCQVTHAWEDGSAVAHCRNHSVWTFDADGSPTHNPRTWYRVKHTHNDHNSYGR